MNRRDSLLAALRCKRRFALSRDVWRASAVIAGLRVAANDRFRAVDRDRGRAKNWLADIWGVVGELVALRRLDELTEAPVHHLPIDFERSVDAVDLRVELEDGPVLLEAKAHLVQDGKAWFMVNRRAHERSIRRGAVGYLPVLTALGGHRALVGSLVTVEQLNQWATPSVRLRDPAIGVGMAHMCQEHFDIALSEAEALTGREALASEAQLRVVAAQAGSRVELWRRACPPLGRLRARELVATVLELEQRLA
jgi:hypothetical protein